MSDTNVGTCHCCGRETDCMNDQDGEFLCAECSDIKWEYIKKGTPQSCTDNGLPF